MSPFSEALRSNSQTGFRSLRILLVEDNEGDARLLKEYLQEVPDLEYDLTRVRARSAALERLRDRSGQYDLIFLDLGLPDSDGLETVRPIVAADGSVPVVVLTGRQDVQVASRALAEGCQDYLIKDRVGPEDLTRAIRVALERHRMERRLRESERRFRQMAENIDEIFYLLDVSGYAPQLLYVNPAFDETFGISRDRIYEDPFAWMESVHPDDREEVRTALSDLKEGDYESTYRIRRPDGEVRWINGRSFPVDGDGESPNRIVGIARDVTEELELRRNLREQHAQLQQIIDEAPAFMALYMGPNYVLERANEAWFDFIGHREAVGKPVREILPELEGQGSFERLDHVYETGESIHLARERIEVDEGDSTSIRYMRVAYQPRVKDGDVVGVIVHGVDITDLVAAHREVKSQRGELEAILETTAEGIILTDDEGEIQYANPAAEEILGLEASEITIRTFRDPDWRISAPDGSHLPDEDLPVSQVIRSNEPVENVEFSVEQPSGSRVIVQVNAAPMFDQEGALARVVASFRDVTEQKEFERQLEHRALHDNLTGLPNRALFRDRLEQALRRARRSDEGFALLYLDLRRFKVVNDSLGHAAGDRVLVEIARRLQDAFREPDTVARMGGDEFTILLGSVEDREAVMCGAERIVEVLEEPVDVGPSTVPVEGTVGVLHCAGGNLAESMTPSTALRRADGAMYDAKSRPGTSYVIADTDFGEADAGRIELERELRSALEGGQIFTVFQPIYDTRTVDPVGLEALARWRHPDRGVVSPAKFIPLAEETGLIVELGEQLLRKACSTLLDVDQVAAARDLRLHVNLSARQLQDPDVSDRVARVLESTGFPAERLTLEITETAVMQSPGAVKTLRELGLQIAIDDFGTQYSSLAQVKRLKVDALKIDRSFVIGLPESRKDRAIVETVLTLGRSLGLDVVAEGVDSEEQWNALEKAGCPHVQGFLFSKPIADDDLQSLKTISRSTSVTD